MNIPLILCIAFGLIIAGFILFAGKQGKTIEEQQKTIELQKLQLEASARINQMIQDMENKKIPCTLDQVEKCINLTFSSLPPTVQEKHMKQILHIA